MHLSERFDEAMAYAARTHHDQVRKGTEIPYVAHLLAVASLVLEDGGTEDEAVAALLHDAVEDRGGAAREADIRQRFGDLIADIVRECSAEEKDGSSWRERKERYVAHVAHMSPSALRVSIADKTHNARAIVSDVRHDGARVWSRFNAPAPQGESVLWYYQTLVDAYAARTSGRALEELRREVGDMRALVGSPRGQHD